MKKSFLLLGLASTLFFACEQDEKDVTTPGGEHEEELITSVDLLFVDTNQVLLNSTFQFKDIDGPGGAEPSVFDTIRLKANQVYSMDLSFLNEAETPAENITEEIEEENEEHIICFTHTSSQLEIVRTDTDGSFEVGLESRWKTLAPDTNEVTLTLKHQPDGSKNGSCTPGETDVEVTFVLMIN